MLGRVVYPVLALGPAILLLAIAANSRLGQQQWTHPEFGPDQHENVLAYAEPIAVVVSAAPHGRIESPERALAIANKWVRADLQNIYSPTLSVGDAPALRQIHEAKATLLGSLSHYAISAMRHGDTDSALSLFLAALQVAEIGKYGSHEFVRYSATVQADFVAGLVALGRALNDEQIMTASGAIAEIEVSNQEMWRISARQRITYQARFDQEAARSGRPGVQSNRFVTIASAASNDTTLQQEVAVAKYTVNQAVAREVELRAAKDAAITALLSSR